MSVSPDPAAVPSPVDPGATINERWTVGARLGVRGDLHVHVGAGTVDVRILAWRYRGSEPLPRFLQHLSADATAWGALRHTGLVPTLDCGRITGQTTCYWITEDPGGPVLAERLEQHPVLSPDTALRHALQVGQGVLAAHVMSLVHGDLDPANVHLVGHDDRARLAWGGLATRVERSGMDAGRGTTRSLAEVSPEVLGGKPPTAESDVYGICALLYRMLAGQPPFLVRRGQGPPPGLAVGESLPPLPDHVPPRIAELVASGLSRDPTRRLSTVAELVDALVDAELELRGMPVPAGAWAPEPVRRSSDTPSTASRSLVPAFARDDVGLDSELTDTTLSNTPASIVRRPRVPPPQAGMRSLVPGDPRVDRPRPQPAPTPTPAPAASGASLVLPAAVIGLAVVLGFGLLGTLGLFAAAPPAQVVVAPAPAPPPIAPIAPPPAPVASVLVLRTDPPGAEVWEGETYLGLTPLDVVLGGGPADPPRSFELRIPGYATHTVRQPWSATRVEQVVPLQKLPDLPAKAPAKAAKRPTLPPLKEQR